MSVDPGSIEHLSEIISHVVAPAFMLGAVASFVSILVNRTNQLLERIRIVSNLDDESNPRADLKKDLPRLKRRAVLLHRAILLSIGSGAAAALLIIGAFSAALLQTHHVWFAAMLFVVSMVLLLCSLLFFAMEVRIGLTENDHR
jgi:phosphate/sulfate permease